MKLHWKTSCIKGQETEGNSKGYGKRTTVHLAKITLTSPTATQTKLNHKCTICPLISCAKYKNL